MTRFFRSVADSLGIKIKWTDTEPRDFLRQAFDTFASRQDATSTREMGLAYARSPEVRQEMKELGRAYNEVLREPIGPKDDPLVALDPDDIGRVLVERGDVIRKDGQIQMETRGHGIVKIIWKHGEASEKSPGKQVQRGDLMKLPIILREYIPAETKIDTANNVDQKVWRVGRRDGEQVNYVVSRFTGDKENYVVSVYVSDEGRVKTFSQKKSPETNPGRLATFPDGTPGAASPLAGPQVQGKENIGQQGTPVNESGKEPRFRRANPQEYPSIAFDDPESESRFREANKGIGDQRGAVEKVKEWLGEQKSGFTRHFIHMPNTPKPGYAKGREGSEKDISANYLEAFSLKSGPRPRQ